jgi:hypothetical protein
MTTLKISPEFVCLSMLARIIPTFSIQQTGGSLTLLLAVYHFLAAPCSLSTRYAHLPSQNLKIHRQLLPTQLFPSIREYPQSLSIRHPRQRTLRCCTHTSILTQFILIPKSLLALTTPFQLTHLIIPQAQALLATIRASRWKRTCHVLRIEFVE